MSTHRSLVVGDVGAVAETVILLEMRSPRRSAVVVFFVALALVSTNGSTSVSSGVSPVSSVIFLRSGFILF